MNTANYRDIAASINRVGASNRGNADILLRVAQDLADEFAKDNPRFNRAKFIEACFAYQQG